MTVSVIAFCTRQIYYRRQRITEIKLSTASVRQGSSHDTQTFENLSNTKNTKHTMSFPKNLEAKGTNKKCRYIMGNSRDTPVVQHINRTTYVISRRKVSNSASQRR